MDAETQGSEQWFRFLAWLEDNWRRVAAVSLVVILVGVVIAFFVWQQGQKQRMASAALSALLASGEAVSPQALVDISEAHAGTAAAERAVLLAAGRYFTDGNYAAAQKLFEQYLAGDAEESLIAEARLGVAACLEAQGKTADALEAYKALAETPSSGNVIPQARFALAQLYARQGQTDLARTQYELLAREQGSSLAREAQLRLAELPPPAPATVTPKVSLTPTSAAPASAALVSTNQP